MHKFPVPSIQDNPTGWGPCAVPEKFKDMPYQPFSKGDRLGMVADWTKTVYLDKRYTKKYSPTFPDGGLFGCAPPTAGGGGGGDAEDDESFKLVVGTARPPKSAYPRRPYHLHRRWPNNNKDRRPHSNQPNSNNNAQKHHRKWFQKSQLKPRFSSVEVRSDWEVKEEMDFPRLNKMRYTAVSDPVDVECCGTLRHYDRAFDRVSTRNERPLLNGSAKRQESVFHTVTTSDDPVIRRLAKTRGNVFATDAILATLMCCTRSAYSWDIVVQKVGDKLFFDKRDDSDFDLLTVSETANEPPQEEGSSFNHPRSLALEATHVNHSFSQQCLRTTGPDSSDYKFPNPNPFLEEDVVDATTTSSSVAYRYRLWKLGEDVDLVVRCEHHGVMTSNNGGEVSFMTIKTLNEWDSRHCSLLDWRQKLDSQRAAVLAAELKNNSYKLARWTCGAVLARSDYLTLGYVSRCHPGNPARHVVLGTQRFKPGDLAIQIGLSMENAWGILRCLVDVCRGFGEGKYVVLKDPNKQMIRVYGLPDGTFSSEEEEEEEEEEDEEN